MTVKSGNDDEGSDWASARLASLASCNAGWLEGCVFQKEEWNIILHRMEASSKQDLKSLSIHICKGFGDEVGVLKQFVITTPSSCPPPSPHCNRSVTALIVRLRVANSI